MADYTLTAIPIDRYDCGESEVKLTLFSLEKGKTEVVVKGTKKAASTLRGATLSLSEGRYFITERRTCDLLREWQEIGNYGAIARSPATFFAYGYCVRYIRAFVPASTPDAGIYCLIKNIFALLHYYSGHDIIMTLFEWGFLKATGIAPDAHYCSCCGETLERRMTFMDTGEGQLLCPECAKGMGAAQLKKIQPLVMRYARYIDRVAGMLVSRYLPMEDRQMAHFTEQIEKARQMTNPGDTAKWRAVILDFCRMQFKENVAEWTNNM